MPKTKQIIYLAKVDSTYTAKNKLQKEVIHFIEQYDRQIIMNCDVDKYKTTITKAIDALSDKYPKCTRVEVAWWTPGYATDELPDWGLSFGGKSIITFWLYAGRLS
ncbi:MAG TPA: hypothetical protein PK605_00310 [Ignavibacteria bacterium]|nr:hypothetical protein [Bacteroidota bacterium]HRE10777.1 hypothetical protein [Ignavibacteria bacterium]HRF65980.1 hypothetical protein [Ignavibacteria bacterium]HRJ02821.1 hypothetical protein [Ignavibacteria bacterium]HRJ84379.1 hypothetical protein [Ignavibacteria bacterium]